MTRLLILAIGCLFLLAPSVVAADKMNVLFIISDDLTNNTLALLRKSHQ